MAKEVPGGLFITLEGPECAGKSTQGRLLARALQSEEFRVQQVREPGGTVVGEQLRGIVKHVCGPDAVCDEAELLIFEASRAQLVRKVIQPSLAAGDIVICDRFADSSVAYQGYARGLDLTLIHALNNAVVGERWPDLTFLLDLDQAAGSRRGQMRLETLFVEDRIEDESVQFHRRVREGFLRVAAENRHRFRVLDATQRIDEIHTQIMSSVTDALSTVL
ncbi:MAG TPA: dTMP kinase [Lentisphaeria bacterium]|nr:dTMP kinase [Lentisphaeria bacterium]